MSPDRSLLEDLEGVDCVARSRAASARCPRRRSARMPGAGEARHREAIERVSEGTRSVRGHRRGYERHELQAELLPSRLCCPEVSKVNGIERSGENPDSHWFVPEVKSQGPWRSAGEARASTATRPSPLTAETGTTQSPSSSASARNPGSGSSSPAASLFVAGHELRSLEHGGVPAPDLLAGEAEVCHRIPLAGARGVDDVDEDSGFFHVAQETESETGSFVGALDDAGDVGGHECLIVDLDHPENRRERRERVVGDSGSGLGEAAEQSGLAGVGEPHASPRRPGGAGSRRSHRSSPSPPGSVSRGARFRLDRKARLPRPPRPPRATMRRSPSCRTSPTRSPVSLSRADVPGGTPISRSDTAPARSIGRAAVAPTLGADLRLVSQWKEGVLVGDAQEHHVAPLAPCSAIGAPTGHVSLTPEAQTASSAVPRP